MDPVSQEQRADGAAAARYTLFFLSGAAGLIYEVVWSRLLREVFGVTAQAVAVVLAAFLAGLAFGGWLLGRAADRTKNPLLLYGVLEIGVGITAVAGTFLVPRFGALNAWAASHWPSESAALALFRLALATIVVLPPTTLMGGTLPAMTKAFVARMARMGPQLSFLYALNTGGAVVGCLLAGFVLIRFLGVHPTLWTAAAVNVAVGAASILLARRRSRPSPEPGAPPVAQSTADDGGWLLLAVACSGVASLALEVIWTRILVLIVGTTTYAFATMLATFLIGIALGSFVIRTFAGRISQPRRVFGWVELGIAASTLATIPLLNALVAWGQQWLMALELRWVAASLARFVLAFAIMIVPTTFIGMSFPLAAMIRVRGVDTLGGELGEVYGANTLGNIAGALAGGFLLLPAVGMQRSVALVTLLNLGAAAWALLAARSISLRRAVPWFAAFSACAWFVASWRPAPFSSLEEGRTDRLLYYREDPVASVKVTQRSSDAHQRIMFVDGVAIAQSTAGIDTKQQVLAHLPFLLRRDSPKKVLSIGLGSGILIGEVARHPGVEKSECVEISRAVIEGSRLFAAYNGGVPENPTVRVVHDDGIDYLRRSADRWDAIISDGKSRHGHVANALFYSEDFYHSAREHLSQGGLFLQWVPLDEAPEEMRTIARTFALVFPHVYAWIAQDSLFLVGQDEPLVLDLAHAQRLLDAPETADLRRHGWRNATELAGLLVLDREALKAWASHGDSINSLEKPVLEFFPPAALATPAWARTAENVAALTLLRLTVRDVHIVGGDSGLIGASAQSLAYVLDAIRSGPEPDVPLLERASAYAPAGGTVRRWIAFALLKTAVEHEMRGDSDGALTLYRKSASAWPEDAAAQVDLGAALARRGESEEAAVHLARAIQLNDDSAIAHHLLGTLLLARGHLTDATEHLRRAVRIDSESAEIHSDLANALAMSGDAREALSHFREAIRLQDDWASPMTGAAALLATHPDPAERNAAEAIRLARRAASLTNFAEPDALEVLAMSYAAAGQFDDAVSTQRRAVELLSDPAQVEAARRALDRYQRGLSRQ